jgi:hypothetical protein
MPLKRCLVVLSSLVLAGVLSYGCSSTTTTMTGNDGGGGSSSEESGSGSSDTGGGVPDAFHNNMCMPDKKLALVPWKPPTAFHQKACTGTQTDSYVSLFKSTSTAGMINTSSFRDVPANATCIACIETDVGNSTHGPVITHVEGGTPQFLETNYGGCVANFDGNDSNTGCGAQLNGYNVCALAECGDCSDYFSGGKFALACLLASIQPDGKCAPYWNSMVNMCEWEIDDAGGDAKVCGTLNDFPFT